jgi:hypothetical protein
MVGDLLTIWFLRLFGGCDRSARFCGLRSATPNGVLLTPTQPEDAFAHTTHFRCWRSSTTSSSFDRNLPKQPSHSYYAFLTQRTHPMSRPACQHCSDCNAADPRTPRYVPAKWVSSPSALLTTMVRAVGQGNFRVEVRS